jgi:hypothetical protein
MTEPVLTRESLLERGFFPKETELFEQPQVLSNLG